MEIASFDDLLRAARQQADPQRLLFVFTRAGLPDDATPAQRADFAAGRGGALLPLMVTSKAPDEIAGFAALVEESRKLAQDWTIVFAAALPGRNGKAPTNEHADEALQRMVDAIKEGVFGTMIPFDRNGHPVRLRRGG